MLTAPNIHGRNMKKIYKIIKFVWKYLRPHKRMAFAFGVLSVLESMLELLNTFILGRAIDYMIVAETKKTIIVCAGSFLVISTVTACVNYFAKTRGQQMMEISVKECKLQLAKHIEKTSLKDINSIGSDAFMERLSYDTQFLIMFVLNTGKQIPENIIASLISSFLIIRIDIICGGLALLQVPLIIILYLVFKNKIFEYRRNVAQKKEAEYTTLCETVSDFEYIKKNQVAEYLHGRYSEKAEVFIQAVGKSVNLTSFYKCLNDNVSTLLKVFLFFYGGFRVLDGSMTVGNFMIIYSYFSILSSACSYFLNLGAEIEGTMAFYNRVKEIENMKEESNGLNELDCVDEIILSHIKFGYNETETILHDFSYTFIKGNMYVVAGGNGCGKSTMLSLLLGMYIDECQGDITYNGHSIKELDMRTLRKERIGVCEQEPYLIEDTIRYNMIYSNDTADDEKLMKLAYHVSFDDFLKNSEKGLDTPVGEGGNALSGGQKQKTALVKAFYKNPDVLVLDEPTSAMDAEGQERLIKYLTSIKKDKIIIVITHDERMMMAADEVVRM